MVKEEADILVERADIQEEREKWAVLHIAVEDIPGKRRTR